MLDRVSVARKICGGKPCVRGTRIYIPIILDSLAEGVTPEQIIEKYAQLTLDDIHAALAYAAELFRRPRASFDRAGRGLYTGRRG